MTDKDRQALVNQALRQAAQSALDTARNSNTNLVLTLDGKPVEVSPDDIRQFVEKHKDELMPNKQP
jgi:hypothetical protein